MTGPILIVNYAEPTAHEPNANPMRYGGYEQYWATRHGLSTLRISPSFAHFGRYQRDYTPGVPIPSPTGNVVYLKTRSYAASRSLARLRFLNDFAKGLGEVRQVIAESKPSGALLSLPSPAAVRQTLGLLQGVLPLSRIVVDIRDPWPDALVATLPVKAIERAAPALRRIVLRGIKPTKVSATHAGLLDWARVALNCRELETACIPIGCNSASTPRNHSPQRPFRVLFVGSLSQHFDFRMLIKAWMIVRTELTTSERTCAELTIAGAGAENDRVRALSQGAEGIRLLGWQDAATVSRLMEEAYVGVAPYRSESALGLTNKLFEYVSASLPFVSTLGEPTATFIANQGIGLSASPTADSLAAQLIRLYRDTACYERISHSQHTFASGRGGTEARAQEMLDFIYSSPRTAT